MKPMDHTRRRGTAGARELPADAGSEPAKRIISGDASATEPGGSGCFDCNICLDSAADPVVTLCGHLYCWPCIYEWLSPEAEADAGSRVLARRPCCPVCKAAVSPDALVPLYGRGSSSRRTKPPRALASIPRRPALRQGAQASDGHHHRDVQTDRTARRPRQARHHADAAPFNVLFPPPPFANRGMMYSTTGGLLGGMAMAVLPWVPRGQDQPPSMYFPSPYHLTPSQRRRHMELERSLHQILFFLFVFVVLCLVWF